MNVLFISKLTGNLWAGPNNSVPAQVLAQSKIDNVMWVNLNHVCRPEWKRSEYKFVNYDDKPNCSLNNLPRPFNKPDYIIFEGVYCFTPFDKMLRDILKSGIPYSIVPRSSLTIKAQKDHSFKKILGNILFYNKFIYKSNAIQYLTNREKEESVKIFKHDSFVIPNGTCLPDEYHKEFCIDKVKIVYIGRLEIYQKGLDDLVKAVYLVKDKLRASNITIDLYGPDRDGAVAILTSLICNFDIADIVSIHPPVFGNEKEIILKEADIFIMTSRFEGMPMGLIEALGYGLPCIASEGTFLMKEIVSHNAGWGAGATLDSIIESLLKVISEFDQLKEKSMNARKLAIQYSWDNLARKIHNKISEYL